MYPDKNKSNGQQHIISNFYFNAKQQRTWSPIWTRVWALRATVFSDFRYFHSRSENTVTPTRRVKVAESQKKQVWGRHAAARPSRESQERCRIQRRRCAPRRISRKSRLAYLRGWVQLKNPPDRSPFADSIILVIVVDIVFAILRSSY